MSKFLLIHGGMHGAWCWERLITELRSRGHEAYALDLPGHGLDLTPRQNVTRQSYIRAARLYLEDNELFGVTLVGHSLAGAVLPEIWDQAKDHIENVIFLAGLVLLPGEAPIDLIPEDRRGRYFEMAASSVDNSFFLDAQKACEIFYNDLSTEEGLEFYRKLTPQSLAVYLDKSKKDTRIPKEIIRYIYCTEDKTLPVELCLGCAKKLGVEPEKINAGHSAMLSRPKELADLLIGK